MGLCLDVFDGGRFMLSRKTILANKDLSEVLDVKNALGRDENQIIFESLISEITRHYSVAVKKSIRGLKIKDKTIAVELVSNSALFDPNWYAYTYNTSADEAALHYVVEGADAGYDPGPFFSTRGYLSLNPDVGGLFLNPLAHFETYGVRERRFIVIDKLVRPVAIDVSSEATPFSALMRKIGAGVSSLGRMSRLFGPNAAYTKWIRKCDTLTGADRAKIRAHIDRLQYKPLISIVMPAYETEPALLRAAIQSVQAQLYPNWELCVADDASPSQLVGPVLNEFAADPRVKWMRRETNGNISLASNSALALATGEFVALMDHDDLLPEKAIYEVAAELNRYPNADLIYSDEDRIDAKGRRHTPYFKPDWNPELFLGHNMISHLGVYRRSILEEIGGFRQGFEGSQDYDLSARFILKTSPDRVRHIPAILYHWREGAANASFSESQIARCVAAARLAKQEYLSHLNDPGIVEANPWHKNWERIRRPVPSPPPLVSLIIPTRDRADLLEPCVDGILNKTEYKSIEVIIIDHDSKELKTKNLLQRYAEDARVRITHYSGEFNYADMNNKAVEIATGEFIGLINNDIEVIKPDWLSEMVSLAAMPGNGVVGAKLLYPNGTVQHAGVVLGVGGVANHFGVGASRNDPGYFARLHMASNVSAVTGACLIVRRSIYQEVGGLDAQFLKVAFNDVDFCLKVRAAGYQNVWTPFAELFHHESPSRGVDSDPLRNERFQNEINHMQLKWAEELTRDPNYNVNFSLSIPMFRFAIPARHRRPWN